MPPPVNRRLPFLPGLVGSAWRFVPLALRGVSSVPAPPSALDDLAGLYARQLKQLLPPGLLWLLEPTSVLSLTLGAIGYEFARIDLRGLDLIEESDPRTTFELLEDWERVLGLPDGCVAQLQPTIPGRRLALVQKIIGRGGQTPAFFVELAAAVGASARLLEYRPYVLRSGFRSGDRCYGIQWVHVWGLALLNGVAAGLELATPAALGADTVSDAGGTIPDLQFCRYLVVATNATGKSLASNSVICQPITGTNTNVNRVDWTKPPDATGYEVYADYTGSQDFKRIAVVGDVSFFLDDGTVIPTGFPPLPQTEINSVTLLSNVGGSLAGGVERFYRIAALTASGESTASVEVSGTPPIGTNTNKLEVGWTPPTHAGVLGWRVYGRDAGAERLLAETLVPTAFAFIDDGTTIPGGRLPATVNAARAPVGLTIKGQALECVVRRAAPGHSIVVFEFD